MNYIAVFSSNCLVLWRSQSEERIGMSQDTADVFPRKHLGCTDMYVYSLYTFIL